MSTTIEKQRATTAVPRRGADGRTWEFVVDAGPTPATGKRRQLRRRGFRTMKAAKAALDKLQREVDAGDYVVPEKVTVKAYLGRWVKAVAATRKASTAASYRWVLDHYVVPRIGGLRLDQLTPAVLDDLYADLLTKGGRGGGPLSARTVRYTATIVKAALADGVRRGELARNAADKAAAPSTKAAKAPEQRWWSPEQVRTFLDGTADDELAPAWRLLCMTGIRRGEVCGLTWDDLDLDAALMHVRHQRIAVGGQVVEVESTKNGESRVVDLDPTTVDTLKVHRTRQRRQQLRMGAGWPDTGLVFVDAAGDGIRPEHVSQAFLKAARRLKLPRVRLHDLRHSNVSMLVAAGMDPLVVARRLGHDPALSLRVYGHVFDGAGAKAAAAVAELVDGTA